MEVRHLDSLGGIEDDALFDNIVSAWPQRGERGGLGGSLLTDPGGKGEQQLVAGVQEHT